MAMQARASNGHPISTTAVGLLALAGAAIAVLLFVRTFFDRPVEARLYVRVASAQGIAPGSAVWLSGLRAGWVERETLQGDGSVLITCAVPPGVVLPPHARVAVTTALFGDRRVEIVSPRSSRPEDVLPVGYVRSAEGLRASPFDPFMRAAARFQRDAGRVAAHGEALRLRARAHPLRPPAFQPPRLRVPRLQRPRHLAAFDRILGDARRMGGSMTAMQRALCGPAMRTAVSEDAAQLRRTAQALQSIRAAVPAALPARSGI